MIAAVRGIARADAAYYDTLSVEANAMFQMRFYALVIWRLRGE